MSLNLLITPLNSFIFGLKRQGTNKLVLGSSKNLKCSKIILDGRFLIQDIKNLFLLDQVLKYKVTIHRLHFSPQSKFKKTVTMEFGESQHESLD